MAIQISDVSNALTKVIRPFIQDNFDKKTILLDKVKKKNLIFTTEKKLTVSQVRTIANTAFDAGRYSKQEFNDWFNKQDI
jgi:hypothetical protein